MSGERVRDVAIHSPTIRLDQFLKWVGVVSTGGQAKSLITGGSVKVNGAIESARSKALSPGDVVLVASGGGEAAAFRITGGTGFIVEH